MCQKTSLLKIFSISSLHLKSKTVKWKKKIFYNPRTHSSYLSIHFLLLSSWFEYTLFVFVFVFLSMLSGQSLCTCSSLCLEYSGILFFQISSRLAYNPNSPFHSNTTFLLRPSLLSTLLKNPPCPPPSSSPTLSSSISLISSNTLYIVFIFSLTYAVTSMTVQAP